MSEGNVCQIILRVYCVTFLLVTTEKAFLPPDVYPGGMCSNNQPPPPQPYPGYPPPAASEITAHDPMKQTAPPGLGPPPAGTLLI